ncbi:hypothetical protein NHX12_004165 [Muraenolepis orangiensis]|uniref:Uncharacterized protein n=1 Tax=Muraenolepis orangiensis TaxID=630683 RepID=A0A9Q0DX89_9TELE|nr:hypothetical protein NHX12_004165 [Muraenolepis orangiensis]
MRTRYEFLTKLQAYYVVKVKVRVIPVREWRKGTGSLAVPFIQCSKLTREIRSANKSGGGRSFMERDMREIRDFNRTINRILLGPPFTSTLCRSGHLSSSSIWFSLHVYKPLKWLFE